MFALPSFCLHSGKYSYMFNCSVSLKLSTTVCSSQNVLLALKTARPKDIAASFHLSLAVHRLLQVRGGWISGVVLGTLGSTGGKVQRLQ